MGKRFLKRVVRLHSLAEVEGTAPSGRAFLLYPLLSRYQELANMLHNEKRGLGNTRETHNP